MNDRNMFTDIYFLMFIYLFIYSFILKGEEQREGERESHTFSTEPDAGLDPTNPEIMT